MQRSATGANAVAANPAGPLGAPQTALHGLSGIKARRGAWDYAKGPAFGLGRTLRRRGTGPPDTRGGGAMGRPGATVAGGGQQPARDGRPIMMGSGHLLGHPPMQVAEEDELGAKPKRRGKVMSDYEKWEIAQLIKSGAPRRPPARPLPRLLPAQGRPTACTAQPPAKSRVRRPSCPRAGTACQHAARAAGVEHCPACGGGQLSACPCLTPSASPRRSAASRRCNRRALLIVAAGCRRAGPIRVPWLGRRRGRCPGQRGC